MRKDNRSRKKFAEELLDAALSNHRDAEPEDGLEDRVLTRLRQQSRAARPASWNPAPVIIAAAIVLALFAADHLIRRPPWVRIASSVLSASNSLLFNKPLAESTLEAMRTQSPPASDAAIAAVSRVDEPRGAVASDLTARQVKAGEREVVADGVKFAKAFAVAPSSSRQRDLALNLNSRRAELRSENGLRIEEAQISEIRLDDIVIGDNERQE